MTESLIPGPSTISSTTLPRSATLPRSVPAVKVTHSRHLALLGLAIWIGFNLRAGVLSVPPLLPQIGKEMGFSHVTEGLLTAIPVLCFGATAIPGARLVRA